ncbi:MAG: hypothetical protein JWN18_615 [Parcubacteria group bacterium]|nr:hypothetical protein [Parcubacteria group bacterium]
MIPFFEQIKKTIDKLTKKTGVRLNPYPILYTGLVLLLLSAVFMSHVVWEAISLALFLSPLWLPILLVSAASMLWLILKRSEFIASQKTILLEIKPPRSVVKTPLAMEAFFSGIHLAPGESHWYAINILGKVRPWWSLEIVSLEGKVHFYIWTRVGFRRTIESQLYAQYPGVQVIEAVDYTRTLTATPEEWSIWGCDFTHTDKDPLPIKTYVEYGLDKVQKEPEQVDPLSNLIETMGSLGKGEYLWLQFIIRVHRGEKYHKTKEDGKAYTWKDEAKEMVDKIRADTRDVYIDSATGDERPGFPNPTKGQLDKIAAIERNTAKLAFDVGARGVYLAKPENFDGIMISNLTGIFKTFSSEGWNGFSPTGWMTAFSDYPWEIGVNKLKDEFRRGLISAYRRRQFYYDPFKNHGMVMSTEELATIFHIPSSTTETPSLERIQSATAEPPANLPT